MCEVEVLAEAHSRVRFVARSPPFQTLGTVLCDTIQVDQVFSVHLFKEE